jgi:hypothetical protein
MAQQTAVEWLHSLHKKGILIEKSFEMAKAMEKEQIIDFAAEVSYGIGVTKEEMIKVAEQHYNKIYNK